MGRQRGFTLIEMLVAMAIFAVLISVLMLGFRQGLLMWEKGANQSSVWLDYEFRYRLIDRVISQALVADKRCGTGGYAPYFEGGAHAMSFVSSSSIMDVPGRLHTVMFEVVDQAERGWQLRYREGQVPELQMKRHSGKEAWVVVLNGLQKLVFSFEAPVNHFPGGTDIRWLSEQDKDIYRDQPEWKEIYDACILKLYPQQIRMDFIDRDGESHRWLFAAPLHADAWTMQWYDSDYN